MRIRTTRFGHLELEADDILQFPAGLLGLEDCTTWVLLADGQNDSLGWLQCTTRPEIALAVVSPRRYIPDYQFRVFRNELVPLQLDRIQEAQVLAIVGQNSRSITLNLKAPVVINLRRRLGRQVVANGEQPIQHELLPPTSVLRKTA